MSNRQRTHRWRGIVAVALLAGSAGILAERPFLFLVAIVGVGYTAYPRMTTPPSVDLSIERTLSDESPANEDTVEVTVRVENEGESFLPDVRIVDGVPPMLAVTDGTARHATALRAGGSTSFTYSVEATHGVHQFEPATVLARDLSGANEVEITVPSDLALECTDNVPSVPIRKQTRPQSLGHIVTDQGGTGIEFHQTREYRRGDPMSHIDWKRFARTGRLTTVEYREERTASLVLCLDGREAAYRASSRLEPHAVAYELAAAERLLSAFLDERVYVGVAAVGRGFAWLAPSVGDDHYLEARRLLATHGTVSVYPPNGTAPDDDRIESQIGELQKRLGGEDQVVLISPLSDGFIASMALRLEASGHSVTVVSPDVTTDATVGSRLAATERENRMRTLRRSEIPVVDWHPEEAFGAVLMRAQEQWFE